MPLTMTGFSFVGIAVTSATIVVYGEAIWDPVTLVARLLDDLPILLVLAMVIVVIAQISTNMAANVVSPSNDFSNLSPRQISFRMGGIITAVIGIISFPWQLYEDVGAYIFTWLVGYGCLLASFLAVMIVDYWILRKTRARRRGALQARRGLLVLRRLQPARAGGGRGRRDPGAAGLPERRDDGGRRRRGPDFLDQLYRYGIFVTFGLSAIAYVGLSLAAAASARTCDGDGGLRRRWTSASPSRPTRPRPGWSSSRSGPRSSASRTRGRSTRTSCGRSRTSSTR